MSEQNIEATGQSSGSQHGLGHMPDDFNPADIKVLAIDANVVSLEILVAHLKKCQYEVTSTTMASEALKILRENTQSYDLVITDVVRPDMDGFKLLEIIGIDMDIPVIMVSAAEDKRTILKAIKHGARDYLIKPVRLQEIRNIWQHVVRKRQLKCFDRSSVTRDVADQTTDPPVDLITKHEENDNVNPGQRNDGLPRRRIQWTREMHSKFFDAIQKLEAQNEKIHPKRILELMNVEGLSRENVASHLQKYRNMLKKRDEGKNEQTCTPKNIAQDSHPDVDPTMPIAPKQFSNDRQRCVPAPDPDPSHYVQYQQTLPPRSLHDISPRLEIDRPRLFNYGPSSSSSFPSAIPPTNSTFTSSTGSLCQDSGMSPYMHPFSAAFVPHYNVHGSASSVDRPANYYVYPNVPEFGQVPFSGQDSSARSMAGYPMPMMDQDDHTKPLPDEDIMQMLYQFHGDGPPPL